METGRTPRTLRVSQGEVDQSGGKQLRLCLHRAPDEHDERGRDSGRGGGHAADPRVERLYRAMGRLEDSSGTLFKVYLSQGLGAHPMVVAYENQLIEFSQENPQLVDTVRSQIAVLYPRPTTWRLTP